MTLGHDDVVTIYRRLLGRPPESEAVITSQIRQCLSSGDLVDAILNSLEWKAKHYNSVLTDYSGVMATDIELLLRYARSSEPEPAYFKDFLGSRTAIGYVHTTANMSGVVEGLPIPNSKHSEGIEWVGAIRAVDQAAGRFVAVELGAGWGPWLVSSAVAARNKGIQDIRLIGVEADSGKVEFMKKHLGDNGFHPADHRILHGIVGPRDGFAYFPEINSHRDWGGEAVFVETPDEVERNLFSHRWRNVRHNRLDCYSLESIVGDLKVDFCHFDIQGAEFIVLSTARKLAKAQIKRLVIGTHSRTIEAQLFDFLASDGWVLENEKPCKFQFLAGRFDTTLDGTQVWRNPTEF
jgi:FkbM family methyltransferase